MCDTETSGLLRFREITLRTKHMYPVSVWEGSCSGDKACGTYV